jgi:hypothetical protein
MVRPTVAWGKGAAKMQSYNSVLGIVAIFAILVIFGFSCSLLYLATNQGHRFAAEHPASTVLPPAGTCPAVEGGPSDSSALQAPNRVGSSADSQTVVPQDPASSASLLRASGPSDAPETRTALDGSDSTTAARGSTAAPGEATMSPTASSPSSSALTGSGVTTGASVPNPSASVPSASIPSASGLWTPPASGSWPVLPPPSSSFPNLGVGGNWGSGSNSGWIWFWNWAGTAPGWKLPPGTNPPPAGKPFQLKSVEVTSGWQYNDPFAIEWTVSGDESQIQRYIVSLVVVRPEEIQPYHAQVLRATNVQPGARKHIGHLDLAGVSQLFHYVAPVVIAVPKDKTKTPHMRTGPARAVFPALKSNGGPLVTPSALPLNLWTIFVRYFKVNGAPAADVQAVSLGGPVLKPGAAVWPAGQLHSHNAILFDRAQPAWNLVARPNKGDDEIMVGFQLLNAHGRFRFVAYAGFAGSVGQSNEMEVTMSCTVGQQQQGTQKEKILVSAGSPPPPLKFFTAQIDTTKVPGAAPHPIWISFVIKGGTKDAEFAPALFGVRMLPEESMTKANWACLDRTFTDPHPLVLAAIQDRSRLTTAWSPRPVEWQPTPSLRTLNGGTLR